MERVGAFPGLNSDNNLGKLDSKLASPFVSVVHVRVRNLYIVASAHMTIRNDSN